MAIIKKSLFCLISFFIFSFCFAYEIDLLSPKKGEWSNKQMLVINDFPNLNGDFFYSLDGSDPQYFGFAYDGPVLIDVSGEIQLKVAYIDKAGNVSKKEVSFSVKPIQEDSVKNNELRNFLQVFCSSGIVNYTSGSDFSIPKQLFYSFSSLNMDELQNDNGLFMEGTILRLSAENSITRYIPCTVFDPTTNNYYRFVIKTFPQYAGVYTKKELPFSIEDWDKVTFHNRDLIYKIDSEFWGLPDDKPMIFDRSESHMISWQSLDYSKGNVVEYYILPPKPKIIYTKKDDGSVVYSVEDLSGEGAFTLSIFSEEKNDYQEQFKQIGIDVFSGEKVQNSMKIGVFSNSVYQGCFTAEYMINKCPPSIPVINASAKSFYSRQNVRVEINCDSSDELYVALSEPCTIRNDGKIYNVNSEELKDIHVGDYKKAKTSKFVINWDPKNKQPVYYKIACYAKNQNNVSKIAEYQVIIDKSSFYFDKNANPENAQGTVENPYTNFEQCYNELKNVRAITLRVKGDLEICNNYILESNLEIINDGDAHIIFKRNGSFTLKGSTLEISKCRISNDLEIDSKRNVFSDLNNSSSIYLMRLENAVLTLNNCQLGFDFEKNGTVIEAINSIVNIFDTIVSANAISYVSFISSVKSRITLQKSIVTTSADVNVVISANEGFVTSRDNSYTLAGHTGRVCELFSVKASFIKNTFKTVLSNETQIIDPIYQDEKTELIEQENQIIGL